MSHTNRYVFGPHPTHVCCSFASARIPRHSPTVGPTHTHARTHIHTYTHTHTHVFAHARPPVPVSVTATVVAVAATAFFDAWYVACGGQEAPSEGEAKAGGGDDEDGEWGGWDDLDIQSQWSACVILACKVYEAEKVDITEMDSDYPETCGMLDLDRYIREEQMILKAMDYCLFLPAKN